MQKKKNQLDGATTTRIVPTTPLFARLNEQGELIWDHEGLSISNPKEIGVKPNCVLVDIREYNRLNGKVTK